jgi:DNA-binding GntR family transcriptional regulator
MDATVEIRPESRQMNTLNQSIITRAALHTQVADALRDRIVKGELAPGSKLNEVELCASMGISRTPLREAIKILEAESLIEIRPHRGAAVAEISLRTIEQIFQLLAPLERLGVELAMARMEDDEFRVIRAMHDTMIACYEADDREGCFLNDVAFHNRIVGLSGNEVLQQTHVSLTNRSQRGRFLAPRFAQDKLDQAMAAHNELIVAVMDRDIETSGRIMYDHVRRTGDFVLDSIRLGRLAKI